MTRIVIIDIPHPPKELKPNGNRPHYLAHSRAKKKYKRTVGMIGIASQGREYPMLMKRARWSAVATYNSHRNRDKDNITASLKFALDALQDAKLIVNDSGFEPGKMDIVVDKLAKPGIRLIVEELGENEGDKA